MWISQCIMHRFMPGLNVQIIFPQNLDFFFTWNVYPSFLQIILLPIFYSLLIMWLLLYICWCALLFPTSLWHLIHFSSFFSFYFSDWIIWTDLSKFIQFLLLTLQTWGWAPLVIFFTFIIFLFSPEFLIFNNFYLFIDSLYLIWHQFHMLI